MFSDAANWLLERLDRVLRLLRPRSPTAEMRQRLDSLVLSRWEEKALRSKNPLLRHGAKYFSQNDEDGILLAILDRINLRQGTFVEIGVGNGLENNTIILLMLGWRGLWVGSEDLAFSTSASRRLVFKKNIVSPESAHKVVESGLLELGVRTRELDVLSIDIDSIDIYVIEQLLKVGVRPRILIVEYNGKFPPPIRFAVGVNDVWQIGSDYMGCSIQTWCDLLEPAKYRLIACNVTGCNAFFVRRDDDQYFDDVPLEKAELFMSCEYQWFIQPGHRPSPRTIENFI